MMLVALRHAATGLLAAGAALLCVPPAAAQERVAPYPVVEPESWRTAVAAGTRSTSGAPGPEHWNDQTTYRIDATLEPETARVHGRLEATYHNRAPEATRRLVLHLRQNLHREGTVRNRSVAITGGVDIDEITIDGEPAQARPRDTRLFLRLPEPLQPGTSTTVAMRFAFTVPPARGAPRMGHEDHHVYYLGYWYPQLAVRDDLAGWTAETYLGRGEFYMPYADYDVTFRAPAQWLVRATGTLQNPDEVLTDTARERLAQAQESREIVHVITADDLDQGRVTRDADGLLAWRFVAENVRDCAVSVSDRYLWDATHAVVPGRAAGVSINAVYEAESRTWPKAAEFARFAIEWMSTQIYPYPWPHMTACEGIIGGGMEYPMMTIIGDSRSIRGLQGVVSHELIHMWFPMIAGSNEKAHAWMDEGTTSFFTDLTTAALRESTNSRGAMLNYIRGATRVTESPLMTHADYYRTGYGFASYTKPAALLHQLRALLRDGSRDVLLEALQVYVRDWAYRHPTPHDLFRTIERYAGRDLDWYWRSWYYEVRTLDHALGAVTDDGEQLQIEILDLGTAPHPCVVEARYTEGRTERRTVPVEHWLAGHRSATVTLPAGATTVQLDPDGDALDIDRDNQTWQADD